MKTGGRPGASRGREVRHFRLPPGLGGKLWVWRYALLRRIVQAGTLLLFVGTFHWGWKIAGLPVLRGDLSASELLGSVPLADPFAALQILLTGHLPASTLLIGAAVGLVFYGVVGGRAFCSWVCPVNPVTDLAGWLRRKLAIRPGLRMPRSARYWSLGLTLVLTPAVGVAAFEWISPIGMLHRSVIFGLGLGWVAVLGLFLFDLLVMKHGWCGHLCPLGAFYGLLGRLARIRVAFDASTCTECGDCAVLCPEPQVLNLEKAAEKGMIVSGECTNCGRCTPICPEGSLAFSWRSGIGNAG